MIQSRQRWILAGSRRECIGVVSPTVFRKAGFRFYFFSREETRPHIHVQHATGEAKFWLAPRISLAGNFGLSPSRVARARELIGEHEDEIRLAWKSHFET